MRPRRLDDGPDDGRNAIDLGQAGDAAIGIHENDAVVVGTVEGLPRPPGHAEFDDVDFGDFHALVPQGVAANIAIPNGGQ